MVSVAAGGEVEGAGMSVAAAEVARGKGGVAGGRKVALVMCRIVVAIMLTCGFGWILNRSVTAANKSATPAGFGRGMLHGALMPGAWPYLIVGKDVVIYAENNAGRLYKLGYTMGVNGCGALFFGVSYYRLSRWRKKYAESTKSGGDHGRD